VFAVCCRPSVCHLSVVCNVRAPYSAGQNSSQCFYGIWYFGLNGQGTKCRWNIAEYYNRLTRAHEFYRQTDRQTDDRQTTDGRATAYSEREHEFTFVKNVLLRFSERALTFVFAVCCRPSVCHLSVVCNVRAPYSAGRNSSQCFYGIWYFGLKGCSTVQKIVIEKILIF